MASPGVTITGKIRSGSGGNLAGYTITASLRNYGANSPTIATDSEITPVDVFTTSASDGTWSILLFGNYQITPENTLWEFNEFPPNSTTSVWYNTYNLDTTGTYSIDTLSPVVVAPPLYVPPGQTAVVVNPAGLQTISTYPLNVPGGLLIGGIPVSTTFGDWINVATFGATGNGSSDDTAAIQSAFAAVTEQQNIVYFPNPSSYYKISSAITDPTSGYLQGVIFESGGVTGNGGIKNTSGSQAFLFTHVSALNFQAINWNLIGPGRSSGSLDGALLTNVTGSTTAVNAVAAANGSGQAVYTVGSTSGMHAGNNLLVQGCTNATNNGLFEILSIGSGNVTLRNNATVVESPASATAQNTLPIESIYISNPQFYGWGGKYAYALNIGTPITGVMINPRFLSGNKGVFVNGGTSFTIHNGYAVSLDKVGYDITNASYVPLVGCASDDCGVGYLYRDGSNACSENTCGHEAGTAFNLTVTNTVISSNVVTVTYSGADISGDYFAGMTVVVPTTSGTSGLPAGRYTVTSMGASSTPNTIVFSLANSANPQTATNYSGSDSGSISVWAGDGYYHAGVTDVFAYACKNTDPLQTTSSAGVCVNSTKSGFRDCNFTQGPGDLEVYSIWGFGNSFCPIGNTLIPTGSLVTGNFFDRVDHQVVALGSAVAATSGANQSSQPLQFVPNVWTGSATTSPFFEIQSVPGSGSNPTVDLAFTFNPASATGIPQVQFNMPSASTGLPIQIGNTTAATSGQNYSHGFIQLSGNYWTGSASAADTWKIAPTLGSGSNPTSTLTISHTGTSGVPALYADALTVVGTNATATNTGMFVVLGTVVGTGGYAVASNATFEASANSDFIANFSAVPNSFNTESKTSVSFSGFYSNLSVASFTGTPSVTAEFYANGSCSAGTTNYAFYSSGTNKSSFGGAVAVAGLLTVGSTLAVTSYFGANGATPVAPDTGYGTPTGNALTASFSASAITLPELAAEVAQLIIDLKATGLIKA